MSWLLPLKSSARVSRPSGPLKTYSFSILTQGNLRRSRFKASRNFESFFSFARSFFRATSHCFSETTLRFSIPRTVLIFGIMFSLFFCCVKCSSRGGCREDLSLQFLQEPAPAAVIVVRHVLFAGRQGVPAGVDQSQPR